MKVTQRFSELENLIVIRLDCRKFHKNGKLERLLIALHTILYNHREILDVSINKTLYILMANYARNYRAEVSAFE